MAVQLIHCLEEGTLMDWAGKASTREKEQRWVALALPVEGRATFDEKEELRDKDQLDVRRELVDVMIMLLADEGDGLQIQPYPLALLHRIQDILGIQC
jgi:hypothetical protein